MQINDKLFEEIKKSSSKILVVTKYYWALETKEIINYLEQKYQGFIFWYWENRLENLEVKNISREKLSFIGALQSKKIAKIVRYCSSIFSLDNIKHAQIIDRVSKDLSLKTKVFIQIKLDDNKNSWINESYLREFYDDLKSLKNIEILWISAIWKWEFSIEEKQKEFLFLKKLRDTYLEWKIISAWTSRDYKIALEYEVDLVRIGKKIML